MSRTAARGMRWSGLAICAGLGLTACEPAPEAGEAQPIKLETFCAQPGLAAAVRETTVVIDLTALKVATPEEFRDKNPEVFRLLMGVADPVTSMQSGASAPRERVTVLAASPRTATLTPVFSGCVPGVLPAELQAASGSAGEKFFGSDLASKVEEQQSAFQRQLLVALAGLARQTETPSAASPDFVTSALVRMLKPLGAPGVDPTTVRRLFIFTDLQRSLAPASATASDARAAGFAAAKAAGLKLGQSEAYLVAPGAAPSETTEQFLRTFMLGSQANLRRVGGFSPSALSPAPVVLVRYRGTLEATPEMRMPMTLQIAATKDGELVNSWIGYTASMGQRTTPLSGEWRCGADQACNLRSDPAGGLGQLWRVSLGEAPEVREDAPLGGLRFLDAQESGGVLTGRISDPIISIGRPGGGMSFKAQRGAHS